VSPRGRRRETPFAPGRDDRGWVRRTDEVAGDCAPGEAGQNGRGSLPDLLRRGHRGDGGGVRGVRVAGGARGGKGGDRGGEVADCRAVSRGVLAPEDARCPDRGEDAPAHGQSASHPVPSLLTRPVSGDGGP